MADKKSTLRYAAIPWTVIDSPAYADLTGEAIRILTIIVRQLTKPDNNGMLQATYKYCRPRGIMSEHTLKNGIANLISHGFIYRTRQRGTAHGKNIWAYYAVTWLPPMKDAKRRGLNFEGFLMLAWQKWVPTEKNPGSRNCIEVTANSADSGGKPLQKLQ